MASIEELRAQFPGYSDDILLAANEMQEQENNMPRGLNFKNEANLKSVIGDTGGQEDQYGFGVDVSDLLQTTHPKQASGGTKKDPYGFGVDVSDLLSTEPPKSKRNQSNISRGWETAWGQLKPTAQGLVGAVGHVGEELFGEGGISTGIKNWGIKGAQEGMEKLQPLSHENDDVTVAWDKAKQGDLGALFDWAAYAVGYGGAQLVQAGLTGGVGSLVAKGAAATIGKVAVENMVAKQAVKIAATAEAKSLTEAEILQKATATVANRISMMGSGVALQGYNEIQEVGSIYPDAIKQAQDEGREFTGSDLAKVWGWGTLAAATESASDLLGLGAVTGKIRLPGNGGRLTRAATAGTIGALEEGTQEGVQTWMEWKGAGKDTSSEEFWKDAINSAAMGALPGFGVGAASGALHRGRVAEKTPEQQIVEDHQQNQEQHHQATEEILSAPSIDESIDALNRSLDLPTSTAEIDLAAQREALRVKQEDRQEEFADLLSQEQPDLQARRSALVQGQQDDFNDLLKSEQVDMAYRLQEIANQREKDSDYKKAMEQAADQRVMQANALSAAQGFDSQDKSSMQLALEQALRRQAEYERFKSQRKEPQNAVQEQGQAPAETIAPKVVGGQKTESIPTERLKAIASSPEVHPNTRMAAQAAIASRPVATSTTNVAPQATEKAYTKTQADLYAARMNAQGLASEVHPHPTEQGKYAIRTVSTGEVEQAPVAKSPNVPVVPEAQKQTPSKPYSISNAKYAKGMMLVRAESNDGFKTRAARLADSIARGRYTNRESGYVLSAAAAKRFEKLYAEGWDANVITGKLTPPEQPAQNNPMPDVVQSKQEKAAVPSEQAITNHSSNNDNRVFLEGTPEYASLEARHAALDKRIDSLTDAQAIKVGEYIGIKFRKTEDIRDKIRQQHPDDQEAALDRLAVDEQKQRSESRSSIGSKSETTAEENKPDLTRANEILDSAGVKGKERLDILKDVKSGTHSVDDIEAAYPAAEQKDNAPQGKKEEGDIAPSRKEESDSSVSEKQGSSSEKTGEDSVKFSRAPVFYSQLARAIEQAPAKIDNGPAAQWKAWLLSNAGKLGVKKDEIQWTGITDWLDAQKGKVSKADIAEYLRTGGVQVEEVTLSDAGDWVVYDGDVNNYFATRQEAVDYAKEMGYSTDGDTVFQERTNSSQNTKFSSYTLPGGENYRELLLTLPTSKGEKLARMNAFDDMLRQKYPGTNPIDWRDFQKYEKEDQEERERLRADYADVVHSQFKSSHFDQPNILAHVRFNERTDAEGRRVLFLEEIQSDWGQKGKKEGFDRREDTPAFSVYVDGNRAMAYATRSEAEEHAARALKYNPPENVEVREEAVNRHIEGVPAAPFVTDTKSWTALALKRMLRYAADNGFDAVAWTTGSQQAERYDLSKKISKIETSKTIAGAYALRARDNSGEIVIDDVFPVEKLPDVVGKELAEKIVEQTPDGSVPGRAYAKEFSGLDLKVGGEGMHAYYDQILPQVASDVLKKVGGGKVESVNLGGDPYADIHHDVFSDGTERVEYNGVEREFPNSEEADAYVRSLKEAKPQPAILLTPEMKETIQSGMALFSRSPIRDLQTTNETYQGTKEERAALDSLNSQFEKQEGVANAFDLSPLREGRLIAAFKSAFGVDVIPIRPVAEGAGGFYGMQHGGKLFVNAEQNGVGFVQVAGHELLHQLKRDQPTIYSYFASKARAYYSAGALERYRERLAKLGDTSSDVEEEMLADFVGDAIADPEFLQMMAEGNQSKFRMFVNYVIRWLKDVANKLTKSGFGSSQYFNEVDSLREYLAAALAEYSKTKGVVSQTETEAFKNWFGDSKVVDADGKPLVVYHGTQADFTEFKARTAGAIFFGDTAEANAYAGAAQGARVIPAYLRISKLFDYRNAATVRSLAKHLKVSDSVLADLEVGTYPDSTGAEGKELASARVIFGVLQGDYDAIESATVQQYLKAKGFDGFTLNQYGGTLNYAVFDPKQIKSAIGNNGNFDPKNPDIRYARVWHGSPHKFDKFDMSKIGTGEGAQAYGHGLYFAESPDVAKSYQAETAFKYGMKDIAEMLYSQKMGNVDAAIKSLKSEMQSMKWGQLPEGYINQYNEAIKKLEGFKINPPDKGALYKVDIPDEAVARMLDWDKPLSQQAPEVQAALEKSKNKQLRAMLDYAKVPYSEMAGGEAKTMGEAFRLLNLNLHGKSSADSAKASALLAKQGIPGIRYLDGGSRADGKGTYNYVLFDDKLPRILERNGEPTGQKEWQPGEWGSDQIKFSRIIGDSGRPYDDAQHDLFKHIGREFDEKSLLQKAKDLVKQNWRQGVFDQFAPVKNLSEHAYMLLRQAKGATGALEALLHHGKLSIRDGAFDADLSGGAIDKVFAPLGRESTDFLYWIAGNRAEELSKFDKEHLFEPEHIAAAKSLSNGNLNFDYAMQDGRVTRNRSEAYKDSLEKFNGFQNNVLDMAEQSGLIDPEARKIWQKEFYVPFYRVDDEDGVRGMNIKKGAVRQKAFEHLKGGTDKLNDLLMNTLANWAHLIDASAQNRAAKATLEAAAVNNKFAHKASALEKGAVWYMDKGKKQEYIVDDPALLVALEGLQNAGLNNAAMKALSATKHWLTMGVTASPFFKVRNLIRDSIQSTAVGEMSYNPLKNIKEGYALTDRDRQEYVSALAGGGLIRFGSILEGNNADRARRLIAKGKRASHILDSGSKVKAFYDSYLAPFVDKYNEIGDRGEEINRMAIYDKLRKEGKSHLEASYMARDLMDFSMQGAWPAVRFLSQIVPFFNARLQGMYKLGRSGRANPARLGIVMTTTAIAGLVLMSYAAGDDERWKKWQKREEFDKDNYWYFSVGDTDIRIPRPFEIGAVASVFERMIETSFMDNEKEKWQRFGRAVLKIASDQLSMNVTPQLFKPVLDVYANVDSFTGRPIESMSMERLKSQYRYNSNTSMPARWLSEIGNDVTGVIGKEFLSPVQIDQLVRGYFSWMGATSVGVADMLARAMNDEPTKPALDYWKLATGGIVAESDSAGSRYVSHIYDQAKKLEEAYSTYRELLKEGARGDTSKLVEAKEFLADNKKSIADYKKVEGIKKQLAQQNERIKMIESSSKHPAEKRILINRIREQQDQLARQLS